MSCLTQAQTDAFEKCKELLREHFDAGVIMVATSVEGSDNRDTSRSSYHGGAFTALGLIDVERETLMRSSAMSNEEGNGE